MNIETRKQYMLIKGNKREKSKILDEYCKNKGQERKYVIKQLSSKCGPCRGVLWGECCK